MQRGQLAHRHFNINPTSLFLVVQLGTLCDEAESPFGIITDGQQSAVLDYHKSDLKASSFVVEIATTPFEQ